MNYFIHVGIVAQIYIILALALNLKTGYSGLISLCHATYYGTGAYLTALLMVREGLDFFFALLLAVLINILLNASITAFLASRLSNLYFTLATIAIQFIFFGVMHNWQDFTGGPFGVPGIPRPELMGIQFDTPLTFFFLTSSFTLLTIVFFRWFNNTPFCILLKCCRDDEVWLTILGKNPAYYKFVSISLTISFATIAGALFASYMTYIDPSSFTLEESILLLTLILIGGTGNLIGPISGVVIYVLLPEVLRFMNFPDTIAANLRMMILALILISIVRLKPNGLFGKLKID